MQVLLVEDDEGVASALAELLGHAGASVIRTGRGADALHRVKGCDLVLLDLGLPDMDGLDVLRTLRRASTVPVIIMTARDSDGAVVLGLRAGADDYLVKPVRKAVLLARIEAVMRRVRRVGGDPSVSSSGPVMAGPVTIDHERREVSMAGTLQSLTKTEFQILATLAARQGEAVSREELMLEVWAPRWLAGPGRWTSSSGRSGPSSPGFRSTRCAGSVFGWTPDGPASSRHPRRPVASGGGGTRSPSGAQFGGPPNR